MNRELGNREEEKGLTGQWSWRVEMGERPHVGGACARAEGAGQTEQPRSNGRGGNAPQVFVAAPERAPDLSRGGGPSRRGPRPPLSAGQPGGAPKARADSVL